MRTKWIPVIILASLTVGGLSLSAGCSGGSGGATPAGTVNTGPVVTRANEGNFSLDALMLAARESTDAWINADLAARYDRDLAAIRQKYPVLAEIRPRPVGDMRQLMLDLSNDAPWFTAWQAGTLTTGDAAVDALLKEFKATKVARVLARDGFTTFLLTFDQPLQIERLGERFESASSRVLDSHPNALIGDGNNVTYAAGAQEFVFSRGWGDCPAGCINRHFWTVRLNEDGTISLKESGTELPAAPAP